MAHKKTKRTAKRKTAAKKNTRSQHTLASADVLARANARIQSANGSVYDSDSIERRIDDYSPILGHDILTAEFGSLDRNTSEYARVLRRLASNDKVHHGIISQCQFFQVGDHLVPYLFYYHRHHLWAWRHSSFFVFLLQTQRLPF